MAGHRAISLTERWIDPLVDLVLPVTCLGCGRSGEALCPLCRSTLQPFTRRIRGLAPVRAAGEYDGVGRAALLRYKERGRRELRRPLALALAGAVTALDAPAAAVVVPVVSARRAARARGGDHMLRLARSMAGATGRSLVAALAPGRAGHESVGLGAVERRRAVHGTLVARRGPPLALEGGAARPAIVVDDVLTTGATLLEAARVLRAAGWSVAGAAVLLAVGELPAAERT